MATASRARTLEGSNISVPPIRNFHIYVFYLISSESAKNNWFGVNILDLLPLQLMKLGCLVITVFSASFGPFIAMVTYVCHLTIITSSFHRANRL